MATINIIPTVYQLRKIQHLLDLIRFTLNGLRIVFVRLHHITYDTDTKQSPTEIQRILYLNSL